MICFREEMNDKSMYTYWRIGVDACMNAIEYVKIENNANAI